MKGQDYVWDLPVRLTHLAFVVGVLGCFATARFHWLPMDWHFYFGYLALGAVLLRLIWGVLGSETARFTHFVRGPGAIFQHVKGLIGSGYQAHAGHNPLGGLAVIAMLLLILMQSVTGLFSSDEIQWYGPLSERIDTETMQWFSSWHRIIESWLLVVIAVHVLAVALYGLLKRDNLLTPMLTGYKRGIGFVMRGRPAWLSWLLIALVAAGIWVLTTYWPQPEVVGSVFDDY